MTTATRYANRGSQLWLQATVNHAPHLIDRPLSELARLPATTAVEWLSPLASESFGEYRDGATFKRLGVELRKRQLSDFWPSGGPVWDGLARAATKDVFLVEAKAHIAEIISPRSRASEASLAKIAASLEAVRQEIASDTGNDWSGTFYQYANRIAHLHFLREQNGIPAHLVFVYFLNARDVYGPSDRAEFVGASKLVECYLGVKHTKLSPYIHKVFVDVNDVLAALSPDLRAHIDPALRTVHSAGQIQAEMRPDVAT